jgi:DNA-binding response OmpR family regulator
MSNLHDLELCADAATERLPCLASLRNSIGKVLVAIADPAKAGQVAQAAQGLELLPTLAFQRRHILTCLGAGPFDLVILDLSIPGPQPEQLLRAIRNQCDAAVLAINTQTRSNASLLTDVHQLIDHDTPVEEIVRRGAALLGLRGVTLTATVLRWGPLELDLGRRQARWRLEPLPLTPLELRLLGVMVLAKGTVVSCQELARLVWGSTGYLDPERVFAHIRRIRKKIESDPSHPRFLLTVWGEGFRLAGEVEGLSSPREPRS